MKIAIYGLMRVSGTRGGISGTYNDVTSAPVDHVEVELPRGYEHLLTNEIELDGKTVVVPAFQGLVISDPSTSGTRTIRLLAGGMTIQVAMYQPRRPDERDPSKTRGGVWMARFPRTQRHEGDLVISRRKGPDDPEDAPWSSPTNTGAQISDQLVQSADHTDQDKLTGAILMVCEAAIAHLEGKHPTATTTPAAEVSAPRRVGKSAPAVTDAFAE